MITAALIPVAALALAAPAAGVPGDKPDKPGKPPKAKGVAYVFKGTYSGDSAVAVTKTNKHAEAFVDQTVTFDFTATKVSVGDTNGDGTEDLADVMTGDSVVVKAKLPKGETPAQPIAAKHLVDQTNPALEPAEPA